MTVTAVSDKRDGGWPGHRFTMSQRKLCPVHRSFIAMSGRLVHSGCTGNSSPTLFSVFLCLRSDQTRIVFELPTNRPERESKAANSFRLRLPREGMTNIQGIYGYNVRQSQPKKNEPQMLTAAGRIMHKESADRQQFKLSTANSIAMCVVGVVVGVVLFLLDLAQKWDAATVGTIVPFWYVTSVYRKRWTLPSFWTVLSLCLVVHLGVMWAVYKVVLRSVDTVGLLAWIPMMMIEGLFLYVVVDVAERKFRPHSP